MLPSLDGCNANGAMESAADDHAKQFATSTHKTVGAALVHVLNEINFRGNARLDVAVHKRCGVLPCKSDFPPSQNAALTEGTSIGNSLLELLQAATMTLFSSKLAHMAKKTQDMADYHLDGSNGLDSILAKNRKLQVFMVLVAIGSRTAFLKGMDVQCNLDTTAAHFALRNSCY